MSSRFPSGLLLITDRTQAVRPLLDVCRSAVNAGFAGIMVRDKDMGGGPLLELAGSLAPICRDAGAVLLVNDRVDVALALKGAGAHVGIRGLAVEDVRRLLGPGRLLGYSAHQEEEAEKALTDGADFVTMSPVFFSRSKPDLRPRGVEYLARGSTRFPGRVIALGGIEPGVLGEVRAAGAAGAAVMGAVMRAQDPLGMCRELVQTWNAGSAPSP